MKRWTLLKKKVRPTPELVEISQATKGGYERHFQASNPVPMDYRLGSTQEALLLGMLLLFGTDKGAWNWNGFNNLSCLTKSAQKHAASASHLKATITLTTRLHW